MTLYIQKEDLKESIEVKGPYIDRDIDRALPAACAAIDAICHRTFGCDDTPVARIYKATTATLCWINDVPLPSDDLTEPSLADVAIDRALDGLYSEAWVEGTDYQFEPLNATLDGKPYTMLRALRTTFPARSGAIKVTARFGWQVVPSGVVEAAAIIANKLIIRIRSAPLGILMAGTDVGVAIRIAQSDPDVAMLLTGLTRDAVV